MSERQLYLFEESLVAEDMSGIDGDGLGLEEQTYAGELEEWWVEEEVAAGCPRGVSERGVLPPGCIQLSC